MTTIMLAILALLWGKPCTWVKAKELNGQEVWLNLAQSGSMQVDHTDQGKPMGAAVWASGHVIITQESPEELMARCKEQD